MNQPRRIMRLPEVITATGYKRSSIYLFMDRGEFPKCHRIGPRAVGWDSLEIEAWIRSKLGGQH
ncbi:TPA: AlpA family transcriptional regulator [Pseudomonas aeruginosa]|uniref:AlpA family transcriptional regulator n=1 Tax=Pseudomonas aeruginosa TaxID=287 RepID=UPI000F7373EB|nr:AlpA family transcriptional regulator [Pseudomonas aeruginosa]EIU5573147.1 AlpA family phage regulatory protein [Pseudomonas aeruginosa]MCU9051245.1 AlpA family transcriptional regulator [Pseudomonas aeruginosa]MCU9062537.1 AlpA family transcriptional regulator [Pseudomonas aeruginosa]MCU9112093.1 AlpA family transcriptional regulator [Pseudomonas aeruginosa]MCU9125209.1 AlpA family transcriptional regulator [Pseudomonas aeruginosa]